MKQFTISIYALLNMFLLLCLSCNKKDDALQQPSKTILGVSVLSTVPTVAYPQTEVQLKLSIARPQNVSLTKLSVDLNEIELPGSVIEVSSGTDSIPFDFTYTIRDEEVGNTLLFVVQAFDDEGQRYIAKEYPVYVMSPQAQIVADIPETAPSVVLAGEVVEFDVEVHSSISLRSIKTLLNDVEIQDLRKEEFEDAYNDLYKFSYETKESDVGSPLEFVFEIMDTDGNVVRTNPYLLQVNRAVELDINEFFGIQWGAQNCVEAGHFLNTTTGEVYVLEGVAAKSADVDLVAFYSGASNAYNVTSPSLPSVMNVIYNKTDDMMANWPVRNVTKIKMITTITPDDFNAITSTEEIQDYYDAAGAESETTTGLIDGRIFAFKTAAEKYGIIIIKARSQNNNTGYMTVDMKIQK